VRRDEPFAYAQRRGARATRRGRAVFGSVALIELVLSWPVWLVAVIAVIVATALSMVRHDGRFRRPLVSVVTEVLALVAHPLPWIWLLGG